MKLFIFEFSPWPPSFRERDIVLLCLASSLLPLALSPPLPLPLTHTFQQWPFLFPQKNYEFFTETLPTSGFQFIFLSPPRYEKFFDTFFGQLSSVKSGIFDNFSNFRHLQFNRWHDSMLAIELELVFSHSRKVLFNRFGCQAELPIQNWQNCSLIYIEWTIPDLFFHSISYFLQSS